MSLIEKNVGNEGLSRKARSPYSKFYDPACFNWEPDSETNLNFLLTAQKELNERLKTDGYLFLNDVYDRLRMARTKAGQIVGWIYEKDNPFGDNFVDFGIYDTDERSRAFVDGYEDVILLDFNVDGEIISRIPNDILPAY